MAEILIAKRCPKTGKIGGITYNRLLLVPAEPPWYVIRMPGGVGGLLSDEESYPDSAEFKLPEIECFVPKLLEL